MFARRKTVYAALVAAGIVFFGLCFVPNDSGVSWLATIGFFGLMVCILAIVVFSVALVVHRRKGPTTVS